MPRRPLPLLAAALAAALLAAGCTLLEKNPEPLANRLPEANLTGGPVDGDLDTFYRVQFYWSGHDADGRVVGFDYLLTNDEVTGPLLIDANLYARLEALGYTWTRTTAFQASFVVSADQSPDLDEPADSIYWEPDPERFHAQHTIFVRAVDDDGGISALPAHRTFTATTLAPEVRITYPADQGGFGGVDNAATVVRFRWTGWDSLQDGSVIDPDSSRFALVHEEDLAAFPDSGLLALLPDSAWSAWRGWDELDPDGENGGRTALLRDLEASGAGASGLHRFFVQAMDEAGAVTSHFQDGVNMRRLRVLTSLQPSLLLSGSFFGLARYWQDQTMDVAAPADTELELAWRGDASHYGAEIEAYRFGWDLVNPDEDDEWSDWSASATSSQVSYADGEHTLRVQCRDFAGNAITATLVVHVTPLIMDNDLLVIDDYDNTASEDPQQGWPLGPENSWGTFPHSDAQMQDWWTALLADYGGFVPDRDYLRLTTVDPRPEFMMLAAYARIVWEVRERDAGSSGLARSAGFKDPFTLSYVHQDLLSPWLEAGGRLLLCGSRPIYNLLPTPGEMAADGYERKEPVGFLTDLRVPELPNAESDALVRRFLPYRWFGVDACALPADVSPRDYPEVGDDWRTYRTAWGMVGARVDGASLAQFGNAEGWTPPDTLRFRAEVYDWFADAGPVFAPGDSLFGLADAEIYNWDWMAGLYDPPLAYRPGEYLPLLTYLPADSTTRWGSAPADAHSGAEGWPDDYCESCYSTGAGDVHVVGLVGLGAPETPSVLLGFTPYYLSDENARGLLGHILTDIMDLPR